MIVPRRGQECPPVGDRVVVVRRRGLIEFTASIEVPPLHAEVDDQHVKGHRRQRESLEIPPREQILYALAGLQRLQSGRSSGAVDRHSSGDNVVSG